MEESLVRIGHTYQPKLSRSDRGPDRTTLPENVVTGTSEEAEDCLSLPPLPS